MVSIDDTLLVLNLIINIDQLLLRFEQFLVIRIDPIISFLQLIMGVLNKLLDAGEVIVLNLIDDVPPLGVLSIHDALNFLLYTVLS